jgi:antitoxin VapB
MTTAKLFTHGGSQAVRLPKEFRFEGTEVYVRRAGQDVVLSARPAPDIEGLIAALDAFEPGTRLERESPAFDERAPVLPVRRVAGTR